MTVLEFRAKPLSRIAAAAAELACCGRTIGNTATAEDLARRQELEAIIAYSTPGSKPEAEAQLALVNEIVGLIKDGTATPEQFRMAGAAFYSALAYQKA